MKIYDEYCPKKMKPLIIKEVSIKPMVDEGIDTAYKL